MDIIELSMKLGSAYRAQQPIIFRQANLKQILQVAQAGQCGYVLGPRHSEKSDLLRAAAISIQDAGTHHASYFSLRDAALASEQNFFATLASDLLPVGEADFFAGLYRGLSRDLGDTAVTPIHPQTAAEFEGALLAVLSQIDRHLALFIDDLEIAPPNLVAALLDVLERVYTAVSPNAPRRFQAIVCGALTFDQIAPQTVSRFQQIARLVWVDDLDSQERVALVRAACQRAGITPTKDGARALFQQTGGDQFLIQQVLKISFDLMQRMGKNRLTPARIAEAAEWFLTMTPDPQLKEMLRQVESDPALLLSALRIMEEDRVPLANLPFANKPAPNLLDLCGIFQRDGSVYRFKSALWQRLLRQNLDDARIGGLYAIAGYWHSAFYHLGKALRQGQTAVRSELFTATINAMHTRQSAAGAFDYLGEGLEALYPESDLHLYELRNEQLVCVYPGQVEKRLRLTDRHQPEALALYGSDYTIALVDQDLRLLIPLRAEEDEANIVGLVSLGQLVSQHSPYQRREELLQLIGFLDQAARVIQERGQYAALLRTAEKRASRMEKMLQMQEAINNQVTMSVQGLLNEIAYSARELFGADSAVIYPLRLDALPELVYEVDLIAASGLRYKIDTASRPRSPRGLAAQVVRLGYQMAPDVEQSVSDYGRAFSLKPIIAREKIRSFVGIRLGTELEPLGILYLNWKTYHTLTPDELTLLEIFLKYAAVALPSARRYQKLQDDLLLSRLELKGLDQTFYGNVHLHTEKEIDKAIKLTLQTTREYTDVPYQYLIRNEPFSAWRRYGLTDDGELYAEAQVDITGGIIEEAFKLSRPVALHRVGKRSTGRLPQRYNEDARSALAVPVRVTGHCFAVLYLESRNADGFTEDQQRHLERIATHLALTLEQSERARALDELLAVSQQLTQEVDLENALLNLIKQAMGALATVDAITFYYEDRRSGRLMFGSVSGGQEQASIGEYFDEAPPIVNQVWKANLEVVAQNLDEMPELKQAFFSARDLKSAVAFPLRVGDERVGCMFFGYNFHHRFGKAELNILHLFAQLASLAILRASLHDEAEQRRRHLEVVGQITPVISGSLGLDDIFPVVMEKIIEAFPMADNACVVQRNETTDRLRRFVNADFYSAEELRREGETFLENTSRRGIANRAIRLGHSINVPDVRLDPDYIPAIPETRSELAVPVFVDGKSEYALVLESSQLNAFTADDQRLLEMLAEHVTIALQNQEQYKMARRREVSEHTAVLAAGLVHDIKSAVASIPDLVDELEEKIEKQTDYTSPMNDLRRNVEVTGRLSGRLKDFVVTENYDPQWIDLHKMIRTVLENAAWLEPPHVNTSAIINDPLPQVWADDLNLELLLRNLLENAYAAIPEGREGIVQITVETDDSHVFIHVQDNGRGIARDKLEEIF
ncbi:MAG TPA: GAF domain-containing protein, partial [Chloroflexi bacterium]|nr:GAF domain-containing protein [Chloroflexota bacterium]